MVGSISMWPTPGGVPSPGFACGAATGGSGSVSVGPSLLPRGDSCHAGSAGGVSAGGGRSALPIAGHPPPGPAQGVRTAGKTRGSAKAPAKSGPGRASTSRAPSAGPTFACAGVEVVAVRSVRGGKGLARGWPSEEGRGLARDVGSNRGTPRFLSDFPGLLPKGRLSACLWAVMRFAPGSRAGGATCGWWGASEPRQTARQAVVRGDPAPGVGRSPGRRPMSSTEVLASCPCPPAGRSAGPRGSTTSRGRGRTGPSTMDTLVLTIPGLRPAPDSPPVLPCSLNRRCG